MIKHFETAQVSSKITNKEKEEITHAINTGCDIYTQGSSYEKGGIYSKSYGDYIYDYELLDYNEYRFLRKTKIKAKNRS